MNPRQTHLLCTGIVLACLIPVQSLAESKPLQAVSARAVNSVMVDVVFSRPVDAKSARNPANYRIVLKGRGWEVPVSGVVPQVDGKTVRLYTGEHTNGAQYAVIATGIKGKSGSVIVKSADNPKYTGIGVPPRLVRAIPVNGTAVDIVFDEPLADAASTDPSCYTITAPDNRPAPAVVRVEQHANGCGVRLTTTKHLKGTPYTLLIAGITDVAGNSDAPKRSEWTYIGEADPAYVTSVKPLSSTSVEVRFSEPVDAASAQNVANYHLHSQWGSALPITGAVLDGSKTLVRLTTNEHVDKTSYSLTLQNVLDAGGTAVKSDEVKYAGIGNPPQIVSAKAVDPTHVDVTFSKPIYAERMSGSKGNNAFIRGSIYSVDGSEATEAVVLSDPRVVRLTVKPMDSSMAHNLHIDGVWDTAGNWVPQCQASVTAYVPVAAGSSDLPFKIVSAQVVKGTQVELTFDKPFGSGFDSVDKYQLAMYDTQGVARSLAAFLKPGRTETLSSSKMQIDFSEALKAFSNAKIDQETVRGLEFVMVAGGTLGADHAIIGGAVSPKFKGFVAGVPSTYGGPTPVYSPAPYSDPVGQRAIDRYTVGTPEWTKAFQDTWKR